MWFRRAHPLSLPTAVQADEICRFTAHIHPRLQQPPHVTPYRQNFDRAIGRTHLSITPFPFNGLAGVRIILGVYTLGDTSWWMVRRRANRGVNTPFLLESPAAA